MNTWLFESEIAEMLIRAASVVITDDAYLVDCAGVAVPLLPSTFPPSVVS